MFIEGKRNEYAHHGAGRVLPGGSGYVCNPFVFLLGPSVQSVLGTCANSVRVLCSEACPWGCLKHPLETSPWKLGSVGFLRFSRSVERIPGSTSQPSNLHGWRRTPDSTETWLTKVRIHTN